MKKRKAELEAGKEKVIDLSEEKPIRQEVGLNEVIAFTENQRSLHGYRGKENPTSLWSDHFPFMIMADDHAQSSADVNLVNNVDDTAIYQYMQVIGARFMCIGRTREMSLKRGIVDKGDLDKLKLEVEEKEKELEKLCRKLSICEGELKEVKEKFRSSDNELKMMKKQNKKFLEDKIGLEEKVVELTMEIKGFEKVKENYGYDMLACGYERAKKQAEFFAPGFDFSKMDACKVVHGSDLVDDDEVPEEGAGDHMPEE